MSEATEWGKVPEVLYDAGTIAKRVREIGLLITEAYRGRDLVMVGVLKGSVIFLADLVRAVDLPVKVDFLGLSSYGDETESTGIVRITSDLAKPSMARTCSSSKTSWIRV
jgi:hypoxanthine phosphoribosyltransferase